MSLIDKLDIINCKSWMSIGDCNYEYDYPEEGQIPPSGVVYCNIEHITKFFDKCKLTDNKYVVVSGFSDSGPAYQKEHPVANDMLKWLPFLEEEILKIGYQSLKIGPRCNIENCNIDDVYSVKMYSFTNATFDKIPDNIIKWFVVNPQVIQNKIQGIPIGVGTASTNDIFNTDLVSFEDRKNWLYINWQNYTNERMHLKNYFERNDFDWVTYYTKPERDTLDYFKDLASHVFVACPFGNGLDCYRILESIYLGSIPIVIDCPMVKYLSGLPILTIQDWGQLSLEFLKERHKELEKLEFNLDKSKLSYWKNIIRRSFDDGVS